MSLLLLFPSGGGGPPPPPSADLVGTSTLSLSETGNITLSLRAIDTVTFSETGVLVSVTVMVADITNPEFAVRFTEYARLSVIVPPVTPPDGTIYVKRVSHTMPAPTLDANGRPT